MLNFNAVLSFNLFQANIDTLYRVNNFLTTQKTLLSPISNIQSSIAIKNMLAEISINLDYTSLPCFLLHQNKAVQYALHSCWRLMALSRYLGFRVSTIITMNKVLQLVDLVVG